MRCFKCNHEVADNAEFCGNCGTSTVQTRKSGGSGAFVVALILAIAAAVGAVCFVWEMSGVGSKNNIAPTQSQATQNVNTPPMHSMGTPRFENVASSSNIAATSEFDYYARNAVDGDLDTVWSFHGKSGEWIELSSKNVQRVSGVKILSGYIKYSTKYQIYLYYANNRPRDITFMFSDGTYTETTLEDIFGETENYYQNISFGGVKETTFIKILVKNCYDGYKWSDTCISEIEVY